MWACLDVLELLLELSEGEHYLTVRNKYSLQKDYKAQQKIMTG